jgi:hypothetical protein
MSAEQVHAKFIDAAGYGGLSAVQAEAVYLDWMGLPQHADVRALGWPMPADAGAGAAR